MSFLSMGDKDNDEDFFSSPPSGGQSSNLGSLFGMSAKMDRSSGSNQSLTYTAPKPPRPDKGAKEASEKKSGQGGGGGVAAASAITAYRYINNQYKLQGKLGIALLSNVAEKDYKILMYVSKQQPVTTAKISPDFHFNVQANNYASFYDDQRQMWSVLFDAKDSVVNFAKQVCLSKFHCHPQSTVLIQDLQLGESDTEPLKLGDLVETKYTGWLVQSQTGSLGGVFDSNHKSDKTFRFKIGKGKVIKGWEEGMQGMKKTGKRFLVVPPELAYGSKGTGSRVPPNSSLAFEVDVLRIKRQGSSTSVQGSNSTDSVPQALEQDEPNFGTSLEAPFAGVPGTASEESATVKGRTASFNEQLAHGSAAADSPKAKLVSRMAKMGQAMLPPQPDLKTDLHQQPSPAQSPKVQPELPQNPDTALPRAPTGRGHEHVSSQGQFQDITRNSYSPNQSPALNPGTQLLYPNSDYQRVGNSQVMPPMAIPYMQHSSTAAPFVPSGIMSTYSPLPRSAYNSAQPLPLPGSEILPSILMESQNNGSKLKTLLEKVDDVSEKLHKLKSTADSHASSLNPTSMEIMDAAQLSFNIQRIVQENERVKKQIMERDKLVQTQSDKITDLLQKNQKLMEESQEQMEKRNVSFKEKFGQNQEKTLELEQQKLDLTGKLSDATSKISELHSNLNHLTERNHELEQQLKASYELTASAASEKQKASELNTELMAMSLKLKKLENENQKLQDHIDGQNSDENKMNQQIEVVRRELEAEKVDLQRQLHDHKLKHENELKLLQEQLQNESDKASAAKLKLEESWKEKYKEAIMKVRKAAEEEVEGIIAEKDSLVKRLEVFQEKFLQLRGLYEEKAKSEEELRERLGELEGMKERYDSLRTQALGMKEKYETTIQELKQTVILQEGKTKFTADATSQVKSVMNRVFQQVRGEISPDEEYAGSDVLTVILNIIKSTTLTLLTPDQERDSDKSPDEEDSEEECGREIKEVDNSEANEDGSGNMDGTGEKIAETLDSDSKQNQEIVSEVDETNENVKIISGSEQMEARPAGTLQAEPVETKLEAQAFVNAASEKAGEDNEPVDPEHGKEMAHNSSDQGLSSTKGSDFDVTADSVPSAVKSMESSIKGAPDSVDQESEPSSGPGVAVHRREESVSPVSDAKPSPPPLFDDDGDDENDLDWLK